MKTTLVIPDTQIPYHDPVALAKVIKVAKEFQPDAILQGGDLIDFPMISQWTKATAGEYVDTLQEHIDTVKTEFFSPLREAAPNAKITWLSGNHCQRLHDYVRKYAYPLRSLDALSMESIFDLDAYSVEYVKGVTRIATNTYALHGHECGGYSSTISAWDTKFCKRYGSDKSFVFFHTHQPALVTRAYGYNGKVTPRFTLNAGSLMDPVQATYVKDGAVSWQQSFAWLEDDGKRVWPELVTLVDRLGYFKGERL